MTKRQRKVLIRIIVSAVLVVVFSLIRVENQYIRLALFLIPYLIIGYDILRKAVMGIVNGQVFDENFLMALATVGAIILGEYVEGTAVMLFYQIGELFQSYAVGKSRRNISALMDIRAGGYSVHSYYFEEMDCYLLSVLDIRSTGEGTEYIQLLVWGCILLSAVFCILFFLLLTTGIVRPLGQFHETILQIRQTNQRGLKTDLHLEGCAEITELGSEFTGMLDDIEKLNRKIFQSAVDLYELKVQKQEAELAYLRSQVDPHFLYNTLEVVRKMALEKQAPEIAQMAVDMGHIFRYSAKGEDEVTLEEEIAIIKSYIRIQQMRFAGKIEVFYFIPDEVLQLRVMKMLLQPIVENSVFHGLEPKRGSGSLFIGARLEGDTLVLTVKDDGIGIVRERLTELQRQLAEENADTSAHVGVLNTNARIRLYYGRMYGISIESCPEDGTTVILRLPAQTAAGGS